MKSANHKIMILFIFSLVSVLAIAGWISPHNEIKIQDPTPQPFSPSGQGAMIDLPEDATQQEVGKEVYRLICSACHAYDGSGLTEEWIATWNPEDQNCWQSKCHGYNHPEDGFYLPDSPPVVGSFVPYLFPTAMDMYNYIIRTMPWQDPGTMPEEQAWAVTAYVLTLNGYNPPEELGPHNGETFLLPVPTSQPASAPTENLATQTSVAILTPEIHQDPQEQVNQDSNQPAWLNPLSILGAISVLLIVLFFIVRHRNNG